MTDSEDRTVVGRLKRLSQIELSRESTELALGHARAALTKLPATTAGRPPERAKTWNRISRFFGRFTMRQRIALGGVGIVAVLGLLLLWGGIVAKPLSAMEKMAENIRKAKSYKCIQIAQSKKDFPEPGKPSDRETTITVYWIAPGSARTEAVITRPQTWKGPGPQATQIQPAGKPGIVISYSSHTYIRTPAPQINAYSSTFDDLENLGNFSGKADQALGTKEIGGKKAEGFKIDMKKMEPESEPGMAEIWIDVETNLPILVRYGGMKSLESSSTVLIKDIQWNIDLEGKLFDTTPPEGYTDATPKPPTLEEQVRQITEALRIYAEASGGFYPGKDADLYNATEDLCKLLGLVKFPAGEKEGNAGKAQKADFGFWEIIKIRHYNPDFAYYGKTVKPNDKEKVLLRWKLDDGQYEVIYGDLRAETVTAEQLHAL
jgi:outer membrane lipoprotein-sorting protein